MKRILLASLLLAVAAPAVAQEGSQLDFSDSRKIDYPGEVALGTGESSFHSVLGPVVPNRRKNVETRPHHDLV